MYPTKYFRKLNYVISQFVQDKVSHIFLKKLEIYKK